MKILIVIPARGGSKGIPRKNLRLLNGKPLIFYTIKTALNSKYEPDVYVSSEDDEILYTAQQFGAKTHKRDVCFSDDTTTLDPVIYSCYCFVLEQENKKYDYIITMQPTSPLVSTQSLDEAIDKVCSEKDIETVIAAKEQTHLSWRMEDGAYVPNYTKRVNRQYLTKNFVETGAFFITRSDIITKESRIGKMIWLYLLSGGEEIDVDTYDDWALCEYHLKRKHILFVVTGNNEVGLGHVYNTLLIANDILDHRITFLTDSGSSMAYEKIVSKNYPAHIQKSENILDDIKMLSPDVVINDRLDSTSEYIVGLKNMGVAVINFEDLGPGALLADMVINAVYPEKHVLPGHYFGYRYFLLRDEFMFMQPKQNPDTIKNVLITFGGVDPNNYTKLVIDTIHDYCIDNRIKITVVAGFGYDRYDTLECYNGICIFKNVMNISKYMSDADIIFTSAGRTAYEIASIGVPAIVMAQNEREMTHFFATSEYGFINLGLGYKLSKEEILDTFISLVQSKKMRDHMSSCMQNVHLKNGRKTVIKLIKDYLEQI